MNLNHRHVCLNGSTFTSVGRCIQISVAVMLVLLMIAVKYQIGELVSDMMFTQISRWSVTDSKIDVCTKLTISHNRMVYKLQ
jgi:hypothetical protein